MSAPSVELVEALTSLGLDVRVVTDAQAGHDLVVELADRRIEIEVLQYALTDLPRAAQVLRVRADQATPPSDRRITLVESDRVVEGARDLLRQAGVSWFDRRGHVFLRGADLWIDVAVPGAPRADRKPAGGRVKLATAIDLLLHQPARLVVRETARRVGAAASSVSAAARALRDDGVLTDDGAVDAVELFWLTVGLWRPRWTPVATYPHPQSAMRNPALQLGFDDSAAAGWALSGDLAAAHLGAPIGLRSGGAPDLYVPSAGAHRLASSILGPDTSSAPAARLAVSPVRAVCEHRLDVASRADEIWLLARPLFVALDLAQDPGRGREVLESWTPPDGGDRVW